MKKLNMMILKQFEHCFTVYDLTTEEVNILTQFHFDDFGFFQIGFLMNGHLGITLNFNKKFDIIYIENKKNNGRGLMKLGEIIKYLDKMANVIIWQEDVYCGKEDNSDKVFEGLISEIPWIYLNYSLVESDIEGEAIDAREYENGKVGFIIIIKEN